ncbi:MAG: hypothetical protein QOF59_1935 [Actinomycetota bacterium]|nr:hypothetical protein [Actinomycetota bacterium]
MFGDAMHEIMRDRRALDAAEAAWLRKVASYDRSGEWRVDGFGSAASALRENCRIDRGVAHGHVALARKLTSLPSVADAFARGDISRQHASLIADAYTPARASELADMETELVDAATKFTPTQLRGFVRHLTDAIDGDGGAGTDQKVYESRECYLSETLNGVRDLRGRLDPLGGKILETALDAEMSRDLQPNDTRTTPQRRADALVALGRLALERGEVGESHGIRPHVTYVVDAESPGVTGDRIAEAPIRRNDNGYLSAAMLELLLCDCAFSRVLVAGRSEILDVGRATRIVSAAQWRALVVRDGHCQAPGCNRPPEHCDAHHVQHWEHGGSTNLENLQLLCWHHHRQRHRHDAQARAA